MTVNEQRTALAEILGWTSVHESGPFHTLIGLPPNASDEEDWANVPHYCTDLEHIQPVEVDLIKTYAQCYIDNLCVVCLGEAAQGDGSYKEIAAMVTATAAQRTAAVLMTYGKWKD